MKKILVPVDFSKHTDISCEYAMSLAERTGAQIILFHSFFDQIYFSDGGFTTGFETGVMLTDEVVLDFYRQKEDRLKDLALRLGVNAKNKGGHEIHIDHEIESGDPQVQILMAIERIKPDLIVMGSGGIGKKRFLTGSIAKKVMDHAEVPVMAVPDPSQFSGISDILYLTGLDTSDAEMILKIDELFKEFNPAIHCLHLNLTKQEDESGKLMQALSLNPKLAPVREHCTFEVLKSDHTGDTLSSFLTSHNIHLIAFIPHRHNIFRKMFRQDLTKKDLFLTNLPILAVQ